MMDLIAFKKSTEKIILNRFREVLCEGLQKAGAHVSTIDLDAVDLKTLLNTIFRAPPDSTFAFNGIRKLPDGESLAEKIGVPHACWLVDSAHFWREYSQMPLQLIITPDQTSADLFRKWGANAHFLPHGGEVLPFIKEKEYPLTFFSSIDDPALTESRWAALYPQAFVSQLKELAEQVLSNPELTYQEAMKSLVDLDDPQSDELLQTFDVYLRAKEKISLIQSLKGLPLHIFGRVGVESSKTFREILGEGCESFVFHEPRDFQSSLEVLQRSSIVLNSSPMFKTGAHERIFYGQGAGALMLTNETPWIRQHYEVGKEIVTYQGGKGSETHEKITALLKNPSDLERMALLGREKMARHHTWDKRATQLLQLLSEELPKFFD
jgi:hypothetical protein